TWKKGGLCAVINQSCCSYVNQDGRIERDLQNIVNKAQILHQVAQDDTSFGFVDLWEKLTSWLPNLAWLRQLFTLLIAIIVLGVLICILARCFIWYTKGTMDEYAQWKKHQLCEKTESGKYFKNH
ncbi:ERVV2 protein, partial [Thinocorus orbignyianus]|nr:ERVV2 protein [Thinocorus orbignyianus]